MADSETDAEGSVSDDLVFSLFGELSQNGSPTRTSVVSKARALVESIADAGANARPEQLNELASLLEEEEIRYRQTVGYPWNNYTRNPHTIGQVLLEIKNHETFYEFLTSRLVVEGPIATRAAAARLAVACLISFLPYSAQEPLRDEVKRHVLEEFDTICIESKYPKKNSKVTDEDALSTYLLGIFCESLPNPDIIEEILLRGLPANAMRYLRNWVLGDGADAQTKDGKEGKFSSHKTREHRVRQQVDAVESSQPGSEPLDSGGLDAGPHHAGNVQEVDDIRKRKDRRINWKEDGFEENGKAAESSKRKSDVQNRGGGGRHRKHRIADMQEREKLKHKSSGAVEPAAIERINRQVYMADKVDISSASRKAVIAAWKEAKGANAPDEAVAAAGDAAAEMVKSAAMEALEQGEAAVLAAAESAANAVVDAGASISRKEAEKLAENAQTSSKTPIVDPNEQYRHDAETLGFMKAQFCIRILDRIGEYLEVLAPVLQERGPDVCIALLRRFSNNSNSNSREVVEIVSDVLRLICSLAAHRKFAAIFVDRGGMQQMLAAPREPQSLVGLSLCLFAFSSLQSVMERVCALSPSVIPGYVALAFQLMDSNLELGRRNAVLFFGTTFVFRPVLEAFDNQEGMRRFFILLRNTVTVRLGGSSSQSSIPPIPGAERGVTAEVLSSNDKQLTFHLCVALRQYFRSHLMLLVDTLRPFKGHRGASRNANNQRNYCKPLDISNEAVDGVIQQLSRDRKLGAAFVRAKWPALETFMSYGGHLIMLELAQAAPSEKYLHESAQHCLLVLQIVTLMPHVRGSVIASTLSNDRPGMAILLDAASGTAFAETEVIQAALLVLANLVCPPPAFCSRSASSSGNSQPSASQQASAAAKAEEKSDAAVASKAAALVGDSRITLGGGLGGPGLAAYMEHGYRAAREAVRANNGIKVLLHLLHPKTVLAPAGDACLRALVCRVLLGLSRDEAIAQILTKLQLGKLLSELLREGSNRGNTAGDQDRWQAELNQVALDLMGIVTNAGRANTVTSEAAAPTLRRIERAAIAAATPINYNSRELLQLIHEHLLSSGLANTASSLLKEAGLTPLHTSMHEVQPSEPKKPVIQWPGSRMFDRHASDEKNRKKPLVTKPLVTPKKVPNGGEGEVPRSLPVKRKASDKDSVPSPSSNKRAHICEGPSPFLTPQLRFKTGLSIETADAAPKPECAAAPDSAMAPTLPPATPHHSSQIIEPKQDRATLDSLVVQYLKHQHKQCPAPITTLPELSLLQQHVCPEPSRVLYAPSNMTARLGARQVLPQYGGLRGRKHNRHFVYSKFRPLRTMRDEAAELFTCATFLGGAWCIATGTHNGEIRLYDPSTGQLRDFHSGHATCVTFVQSAPSGEEDYGAVYKKRVLLSSAFYDVKLWNPSSVSTGPVHTFEECKAARFNNSGSMFGALPESFTHKEVLLYDVGSCSLRQKLSDGSLGSTASSKQSIVHFSPSDELVLWSGVLWDHRIPRATHRFDQFTDYGGGGFHPAGNEVIINSEVWDLRTFKLLRSVPSLDQTVITFNATGEVIYATLRRNSEEISSALHSRRARHPLFQAFRTMDAVDYTDIATTQVDRCVLDLAAEPTDSLIGVAAMDSHEGIDSIVKLYEVGRRRPTDDDSDPDDVVESDESEDEDDDEDDDGDGDMDGDAVEIDANIDLGRLLEAGMVGDMEDDVGESSDEEDDDEDGGSDDEDDVGGGVLRIVRPLRPAGDEEDDDEEDEVFGSSGDEEGDEDDDGHTFNGLLQRIL